MCFRTCCCPVLAPDGKLDWSLEFLRESGCDGVMFESPATDLDAVLDVFGDAFMIGGIDAGILTRGTPEDVRQHTHAVCRRVQNYKGFALCCSGGLAGNMPLENMLAYFDVRKEYGFTEASHWGEQKRGG